MSAKTDKVLKYLGIGFLVYQAFNWFSNQAMQRFAVGRPSFRVRKLNPTFLDGLLTIPITNSTPVNLPIDGFKGDILYGQYRVAGVAINQPVTLAGNQTINLEISVSIDYANLADNIVSLVTSGEFLQNLRVKGQLLSSGLIVPINQSIQIL